VPEKTERDVWDILAEEVVNYLVENGTLKENKIKGLPEPFLFEGKVIRRIWNRTIAEGLRTSMDKIGRHEINLEARLKEVKSNRL
jgi:hypothetical protein